MTAIQDPSSAYPPQHQAHPLHVAQANKPLSNGGEKQLTGEGQKQQSSQPVAKLPSKCAPLHCNNASEGTSGIHEGTGDLLSKSSCGKSESVCSASGPPRQKNPTVTVLVTNGVCLSLSM